MPRNLNNEDLRIKRTNKLLIDSMFSMLKRENFNQLTVNDLCKNAQISRATFYFYFSDKYDLLEYWLSDLSEYIIKDAEEYEKIAPIVNQYIYKQKSNFKYSNRCKEGNI